MFGLFNKRRLPITLREKVWVELRLAWLADQFGLDRMLSAEFILPTTQYFPEPYNSTETDAKSLLQRVCGHMGVDPTRIAFRVRQAEEMPGAAGLYEPGAQPTISVEESQLVDQESLIATLAHEVAHELLLGEKRLLGDEDDHEEMTDLLMAFLGMGVFAANTRVQQRSERFLNWESWSIRQLGYLTARVYGYSFAVMMWERGEMNPAWAKYLGKDAWYALRDGLRYLSKTDDTLFKEEVGDKYIRNRPIDELLADLQDTSDSVCVASMWSLADVDGESEKAVAPLITCLAKRSTEVKREAILALGSLGNAAHVATPDIMSHLRNPRVECREAATIAIGLLCPALNTCGPNAATILEELALLIDDNSRMVRHAAVAALKAYGPQAAELAPRLMPAYQTALVNCDYHAIDHYTDGIMATVTDVDLFLRRELATRDRELYDLAVDILRERRELQEDSRDPESN